MEPVPETVAAFEKLGEASGLLEKQLRETARRVQEMVPDCVGLSLALAHDELTFTLVATDSTVAALDALQYLGGGPCVETGTGAAPQEHATKDLLDEGRWLLLARGEAVAGVASTLSLPLAEDGSVVGSLNLYGSSESAFDGRRQQLADLLGAWEPGIVANADLGFTSRLRAAAAPLRLEDQDLIDQAVGVLVAAAGMDRDEAMRRIRESAAQAGILAAHLARLVVRTQHRE